MFGLEPGARAPSVSLKTLDGQTYSIGGGQTGWQLLVFFKTDCPTTAPVMHYVNRIYDTYGDSPDFHVWGISQNPAAETAPLVSWQGIQFPIVLDEDWQASSAYDLVFVPTLLLVDDQGVIRTTHTGLNKAVLNNLSADIAEHLGRPVVKVALPDDGQPVFRPG